MSNPTSSNVNMTQPPTSILNMKVGDILKTIMNSLQQLADSAKGLAQSESDPTTKAALSSVAKTIDPTNAASTYTSTSTNTTAEPTVITITQGTNTTSTSLPSSSVIPTPSTTYTTPQPQPTTPQGASTTTSTPSTPAPTLNLKESKRPTLPTVITIVGIIIVGFFGITLALSDTFAFLTYVALIAFIGFILYAYGFVQVKYTKDELDITYDLYPFAKLPDTTMNTTNLMPAPVAPTPLTEVFYVSDNVFTYAQAPAVCKAYGAELASYFQVEQAYNQGAEWCGYGWSEGGIALFPTQQATWEKLQKEQDPAARIKCGRPGINGGYFDPNTKFGVNCYGVRPAKKASDASPNISTSSQDSIDRLVSQFQQNLSKYVVSPFNQKEWSEVSGNPQDIQLSLTQTNAKGIPGTPQADATMNTAPFATKPTQMTSILASQQIIPTSPIPPPPNVNELIKDVEELGSAPIGVLNDAYNQVSDFVQSVV
jgi:Extracellular link domain